MPQQNDHTRTASAQPYRTTKAAQRIARQPRPRITLYLHAGTWMSDNSHAADADEIRRLMDTDQIPTAFTHAMDWREVQRRIEALNPGHEVIVDILSRQDTDEPVRPHPPTAQVRVYEADGRTSTVRRLVDVLSPKTRATLAAIEKGGRQ